MPSDFLMPNLNSFKRAGMHAVATMSPDKAAAISKSEHAQGHHVVIIGMSRGTIQVAQAQAAGAQVSRAVFVSGNFKAAMGILHTPARVPETLVAHERHDRAGSRRRGSSNHLIAGRSSSASIDCRAAARL